jgi:hypothetical protein
MIPLRRCWCFSPTAGILPTSLTLSPSKFQRMRSKSILVIAFSIGLSGSTVSAQYDTTKIDVQLLRGIWESNDSVKHRIEFVDSLFGLTLFNKNAGRPYYFSMDSSKKVSVMGFYPNWPPFDCHLNLIAPGILDISYSQLGVTPSRKRYLKVKS